jgi:hypothetical protein
MNATNKNTSRLRQSVLAVLSALLVLTALGAAVSASARDDRGWDDHARRARDWHQGHRSPYDYGYAYSPGVVYAPPPVVYAPPPPSPGINLVIPLDFR